MMSWFSLEMTAMGWPEQRVCPEVRLQVADGALLISDLVTRDGQQKHIDGDVCSYVWAEVVWA